MPLKYAAGEPAAVAMAGRIHGGLFVAFGLALASVGSRDHWPRRATLIALVAACVPLGAFWLERKAARQLAGSRILNRRVLRGGVPRELSGCRTAAA